MWHYVALPGEIEKMRTVEGGKQRGFSSLECGGLPPLFIKRRQSSGAELAVSKSGGKPPHSKGVVRKVYATRKFLIAASSCRNASCNAICVNAAGMFAPRTVLARIYR